MRQNALLVRLPIIMSLPFRSFAALALLCAIPAQSQEDMAQRRIDAVAIYSGAKPYIDLPMKQLRRQIEQLGGLKEDEDQQKLPAILEKTGGVLAAQLPRIPNLAAREDVTLLAESTAVMMDSGSTGAGRGRAGLGGVPSPQNTMIDHSLNPTDRHRYEYIVQRTSGENGMQMFDEARKDGTGSLASTIPLASGFGGLWMMFIPGVAEEQRFRYIGLQKIKGRMTDVIVFAQVPEKVSVPGTIRGQTYATPMLQQGVAWIDQETGQLVRIRTDLLAPLPQIQTELITSVVDFTEIKLPGFDGLLWLPKQVNVEWKMLGKHAGEDHSYSNYRLYSATVRIVPD